MAGGTAGTRLGQSGEPGINGGCRLSPLSKAPSAPHYPPPTPHLAPFANSLPPLPLLPGDPVSSFPSLTPPAEAAETIPRPLSELTSALIYGEFQTRDRGVSGT